MARQEWVWCAQVSILIKNKHQVPEASYPEIPSTGCEAALHNAQLSRPSPAADTLQGGPGSAALEPVLSSCFWTSAVQGMQHTLLELSCFNPSPLRDFLSEGNTIILRKFGTEVDPAISLSSSAWRTEPRGIDPRGWLGTAAIRGRHWTSKGWSTRQWGWRGVSGPISFPTRHSHPH